MKNLNNDLLKIKSKSKSRFNISTVSQEQMLKDIEQQNEQNIRNTIKQMKTRIEQNDMLEEIIQESEEPLKNFDFSFSFLDKNKG